MRMTNEEYKQYSERRAPRSPVKKNMFNAFWIGGLICCLGQLFLELYTAAGLETQAAGTAEAISLVLLGAVLTGLGVYDDIARVAGAGTLVPITGFANAVVSPAMEFKSEGRILGTAAAAVYGLIHYFVVMGG